MMNNIIIARLALQSSNPKTGWLDRQKFAELIVRECAKMVDTDGDAVMALRMMKHFGVEE